MAKIQLDTVCQNISRAPSAFSKGFFSVDMFVRSPGFGVSHLGALCVSVTCLIMQRSTLICPAWCDGAVYVLVTGQERDWDRLPFSGSAKVPIAHPC